jgi:hypothetical protein
VRADGTTPTSSAVPPGPVAASPTPVAARPTPVAALPPDAACSGDADATSAHFQATVLRVALLLRGVPLLQLAEFERALAGESRVLLRAPA